MSIPTQRPSRFWNLFRRKTSRHSRAFVPRIEGLEERVVLNAAPVATADSFGVFNAHALVVEGGGGLLQNDTDVDLDFLSISAVNGLAADVGQPVTLGSGATVTVADDGAFIYSPAGTFAGTDSFSCTVSDGVASAIASVSIQVSQQSLDFPAILAQTNLDGDTVSLTVAADNSGGPALTFSATDLPDGLSINPTTGAITGTIPPGATTISRDLSTTVTVSDGTNAASRVFMWTVDSRVTVSAIADRTSVEGDTVSIQATASIPGGATLTYGAFHLPDGLSIDPDTGLISGTIAPGAADPGRPYVATITATDGTYFGSMTFEWTVTSPVTVAAGADQQTTEGDAVSVQASASVPGAGTLTYSAEGLPAGLSIDPSTGLITGTVAPDPTAHDLPALVTVSATDGTYTGSRMFFWEVVPRVSVVALADWQMHEGNIVTLQIQASIPGGGTLTYAATGLPPGLSLNATTGEVSGTLAPGAAVDSPYSVTVSASDGTYSASCRFNFTVDPRVYVAAIADREDTGGETVSLQVSASSLGGGPLTYVAIGLPAGLSMDASTGLISGTLSAGLLPPDPLQVWVTVSDGTYSTTRKFFWRVVSPLVVAAVADQSSLEGNSAFVQASATAPGGTLTFSATGLPMGLSIDPASGLISGTISAGAAIGATYLVTVTATDGTSSGSTWFLWAVSPRISVEDIADQVSAEGEDVSPLAVQASVPSGAALTYFATGLPTGLDIDPGTGEISGTLASGTATQGNANFVTVTVNSGAYYASRTFRWTVDSIVVSGGIRARTDSYTAEPGRPLLVAGGQYGLPGLLANDTASSGDPLTITAINGSAGAVGQEITLASDTKLWVEADGTFGYVPGFGLAGVESFTDTVTNGSNAAVVQVFVNLAFAPVVSFDFAALDLLVVAYER